jgi:hypothetical protein
MNSKFHIYLLMMQLCSVFTILFPLINKASFTILTQKLEKVKVSKLSALWQLRELNLEITLLCGQ